MKAEIYIAFYDYSAGLGWWRTQLIKTLTRSKVSHVGLIFSFPFADITPMVIDGEETRLMTTFILEQKGGVLIYKKFMGTYDTCLEDIKQLAKEHPIWTWYKVLLWYLFGRWIGIKPNHCGTLAANWLNKNLKYNFKLGHTPHLFMQEVKNDYHYDWR
jgi:hypothetical protein